MKIRCPICREMTTWEENPFRPFCSERCKLTDLGGWATETYRVPAKMEEEEDEGGSGQEEESRE
ncbi:MAG: DNA gyrase inhibitor YacG [Nitrospiraceae bacterium]|nr:DNA gyrase inhibitor YacG [Nitrospiraceae bacterium]